MKVQVEWILDSIRKGGAVPIAFFLFHLIVSKVFEGYIVFPWLDIPMHFFGGVAISFFFWRSLNIPSTSTALGQLSTFAKNLLCLALVSTSTVIWEFAEWSTDSLGITESQLGLDDTLLDMGLGLLGGVVFLAVASGMVLLSRIDEGLE